MASGVAGLGPLSEWPRKGTYRPGAPHPPRHGPRLLRPGAGYPAAYFRVRPGGRLPD
jgi:hypothetical protein